MQVTGAGDPGERVALDILGPLPTSIRWNEYILVIRDYFTTWAEAIPLPNTEVQTLARAFIDNYVTKYVAPRTLQTEQGCQFESRLLKQLCDLLRITRLTRPNTMMKPSQMQRNNMICYISNSKEIITEFLF